MRNLLYWTILPFFVFALIYDKLLFPNTTSGNYISWTAIVLFYGLVIGDIVYSLYKKRAQKKVAKILADSQRQHAAEHRKAALQQQAMKQIKFPKNNVTTEPRASFYCQVKKGGGKYCTTQCQHCEDFIKRFGATFQ